MSDWRSSAWYQIHLLGQLLGADDAEVKRRERMFSAIDAFSHPAHKEAQFHQLEGATRMEADLLRPMLEAEHVRAHILPPAPPPPAPAPAPASPGPAGAHATSPAASRPATAAPAASSSARLAPAEAEAPVAADDDDPPPAYDFGDSLDADPEANPWGAAAAAPPAAQASPRAHSQAASPVAATSARTAPAPVAAAPATSLAPRVEPKPAPRAPEPDPPAPARSEFTFVPLKEKKKARGESPGKLYQEAMDSWNEYQQNENKGTVDGRSKARGAARAVRDLVLRLGRLPDGSSQFSALLAVIGLSEQEVLDGELERRLR